MISLPPIPTSTGIIELPLTEDSARSIAAILLHEAAAERSALWAELLAVDPPLLLWVSLLHARADQPRPESIEQVARWFAPEALYLLDWAAAGASTAELTTQRSSRWREIVQQCLLLEEYEDEHLPLAPQRSLQCLLRAMASSEVARVGDPLPGWMATVGEELWPESASSASDPEALTAEVKRAIRRWRTKTTGSGGMLPRLTDRLRRLDALENRFEQTLLHEKLSAMRELAYGASHEINNPLANISTRAQTLLQEEQDPERRRMLATVHLQAMRAHEMIANLMHFAKPPQLQRAEIDLGECLSEVVQELTPWAKEQGTTIQIALPAEACLVEADREQIMIALRALLRNALEALAAGGQIDAELSTGTATSHLPERQSQAMVTIRDNGPGVSAEALPHMFDPFYSGREAGRGLGFGLAWSWRVIERHGGHIEVESQPGHGAEFRICMPVT